MKSHEFITEDVSMSDLNLLRHYLHDRFKHLNLNIEFSNHFYNRVNDARNGKPITICELTRLFREELKNHGKDIAQLPNNAQAVLKDLATKINVPIAVDKDADETDVFAKTVMRKKDFGTSNRTFAIESKQINKKKKD